MQWYKAFISSQSHLIYALCQYCVNSMASLRSEFCRRIKAGGFARSNFIFRRDEKGSGDDLSRALRGAATRERDLDSLIQSTQKDKQETLTGIEQSCPCATVQARAFLALLNSSPRFVTQTATTVDFAIGKQSIPGLDCTKQLTSKKILQWSRALKNTSARANAMGSMP